MAQNSRVLISELNTSLTPDERQKAIETVKETYQRELKLLYPGESPKFFSDAQLTVLTTNPYSTTRLTKTLGEPERPSFHYTAMQKWPKISGWYGLSVLDLSPEQAMALSQTDDPSEVLGDPEDVLAKANLEELLRERKFRSPNGGPRGYSTASGSGNPKTAASSSNRPEGQQTKMNSGSI